MAPRCSACGERDFEEVAHYGGTSPAWPLSYADFAPWYDEAERLFHVHGARGEDSTEPPSDAPYPFAPVQHEAKVAELSDKLTGVGLHPFHLPLGILLDQQADGRGDADQRVHPLFQLRRLSLPVERQGGTRR